MPRWHQHERRTSPAPHQPQPARLAMRWHPPPRQIKCPSTLFTPEVSCAVHTQRLYRGSNEPAMARHKYNLDAGMVVPAYCFQEVSCPISDIACSPARMTMHFANVCPKHWMKAIGFTEHQASLSTERRRSSLRRLSEMCPRRTELATAIAPECRSRNNKARRLDAAG